MDETRVQQLVREWYSLADVAPDPLTRFVFLWICFNAWLAFESQQLGDRKMINWLKGGASEGSVLRSACEDARRAAAFSTLLREIASEGPVSDPRPGGQSVSVDLCAHEYFGDLVEFVYQVRCNLFHGQKRPDADRDLILVRLCGSVVDGWVSSLISRWSWPSEPEANL